MERDEDLVKRSLLMWRNYIETGNVVLSANDAINSGQPKLVRALDQHQKQLVHRLEQLAESLAPPAMRQEVQNVPPNLDLTLGYGRRYHRRCEDYDRSVCSARTGGGLARPNSPRESDLIDRHAASLRDFLAEQMIIDGLADQTNAEEILRLAIRATRPHHCGHKHENS